MFQVILEQVSPRAGGPSYAAVVVNLRPRSQRVRDVVPKIGANRERRVVVRTHVAADCRSTDDFRRPSWRLVEAIAVFSLSSANKSLVELRERLYSSPSLSR